MRFRLAAPVKANTVLGEDVTFIEGKYTVELRRAEDSGLLTEIAVSVPVEDYADFLPRFEKTPEPLLPGRAPGLVIPSNPFWEDLTSLLQSMGVFWLEIEEIDVREAESVWIPETPEERGQIEINNIKVSQVSRQNPKNLNLSVIQELVRYRDQNDHLVIPFSFLRVAMSDFASRRYLSSFYNFYFFLESLYGKGRFRSRDVKQAFKKSEHIRTAVGETINMFAGDPFRRNDLANLNQLSPKGIQAWSVERGIDFIVDMRGHLHHYSATGKGERGHPLNQHRYEPLAYFGMNVCLRIAALVATGDKSN